MKSGSCMVSRHMVAHARNTMVPVLWPTCSTRRRSLYRLLLTLRALRTGDYQAVPIPCLTFGRGS